MIFTSDIINIFRIQTKVPSNAAASNSSGLSEAQSILSSIGASNERSARSDFKAVIQEVPEKLRNSPSYYSRFFRGVLQGAEADLRNDPNFYYSLIREAPPGTSIQSYLELIEMAPEKLRECPAFYLPIILRAPKYDVQGYRTFCRELIRRVPESVRNHPDLYFYLIREASEFNRNHPSFYELFREAPEAFRSNPELLVASLRAAPKCLRRNGEVYAWMAYIAPEPLQYEIGFYCKLARAVPEKLRDNRLFYLALIRAAPAELKKNLMFYVHLIKAAPEDLPLHYLLIQEAPETVQQHFWLYCTMSQLASEDQAHLISELDELLLDGMSFDKAMQAVRKELEKQELIRNAVGYLESQLALVRNERKKVTGRIWPEPPAQANSKTKERKEKIDVINRHLANAVQYIEDHHIQYDSKDDREISDLYEEVFEHIRSLKRFEEKHWLQFEPIHVLEKKMGETVESRLKDNKTSIDKKLRQIHRFVEYLKEHKQVYPSYESRKLLELTCRTLEELVHKELRFYAQVKKIYEGVFQPVFITIHEKNEIKFRVNELFREKKRLDSEERSILSTMNHLSSLKEESVERLMSDPVFQSVTSSIQYKQSHQEWSTRS